MKQYLTALVLALGVTFSLGMKTSTQAVNFADSNDLLLAATHMGLAHPPGYPLLVVLLAIVSRMFGAVSITVVSGWIMAVLMGSATGLLLLTLREIGWTKKNSFSHDAYALIAALLWLTIPLNWVLGTVAEIMPLGIVFILLGSFFCGKKQFVWVGFFSVLAALHHPLLVLVTGGIWFISLFSSSSRAKRLLQMGCGAGMAVLVTVAAYALLTHTTADYSWEVPRSVAGWWQMYSRQSYTESGSAIEMFNRETGLSAGMSSMVVWLKWWFTKQWGWLLGLLCLLGISSFILTRQWKWLLLGSVGLIVYGPGVAFYVKHPAVMDLAETAVWWGTALRERMFYVFFLILPFFIYTGMQMVGRMLQARKRLQHGLLSVLVIFCGWRIYDQYCQGSMDTGANAAAIYSKQILTALPEQAVLVVQTDEVFSFLFAQLISHVRQDISIVPVGMVLEPAKWQRDHLALNGFTGDQQAFVVDVVTTGLRQRRPVFLYAVDATILSDLGLEGNPFYGIPEGLLLRVQQEPPKTLPDSDYGVSVQLASIKTLAADNWFKGFRAHLASLHTQQTYYLARLGFVNQAVWHANIARNLFYESASRKIVDTTLEVGSQRFAAEGRYWSYVPLSVQAWRQRSIKAQAEGKQEEAAYFESRARLLQAVLGR